MVTDEADQVDGRQSRALNKFKVFGTAQTLCPSAHPTIRETATIRITSRTGRRERLFAVHGGKPERPFVEARPMRNTPRDSTNTKEALMAHIDWKRNAEAALEEARRTSRMVLLDFSAAPM
jgi:hypothetical protein